MTNHDDASATCPACHAPHLHRWFTKENDRGAYQIVRCAACKSGFVLPRPSPDKIADFYRSPSYPDEGASSPESRLHWILARERTYPNAAVDAARILRRCRRWAVGDQFLDIGAGYGFFSKAAAELGFEVTALEPSPRCREIFSLMNHLEAVPSELMPDFVAGHAGRFDVVLMSQVLEHVADLDWTVSALGTLLKGGGVAAIAVPHFRSFVSLLQGKSDMFIIPPEHLNFFTRGGLETLFRRHGFETLAAESISRFDPARIRRRLGFAPLAAGASLALRVALGACDYINKGMYLNLYFQKRR